MRKYSRRALVISLGAAMLARHRLTQAAPTGLDVALVNGAFWTGLFSAPAIGAIGIRGNRIAAIGSDHVQSLVTRRTEVIDLHGAFGMPAFTDAHTHFLQGARILSQPDLLGATSRAEFAERVGAAARAHSERWILGGTWDEQRMGGALPTRDWIDAVTPNTPVAVPRTDLHSFLLNSVALRLAGITRDTPDPAGGVIVRDDRGEPTGILKDNAKALVTRVIPPVSAEEVDETIRFGIAHALSKGVGQIHNPEINWEVFDSLRRLRAKGETNLRFYAFVPILDWEKLAAIVKEEGRGDDWVRWGGVKALSDGSLGSRTAVFYDDYTDDPGQRGIWVTEPQRLKQLVAGADRHGLHVAVHAIGDKAIDTALDIFSAVEAANGAKDRRFRIEHAQHVRPDSIPRFARQKVVASVQPYHAIDDGRWAVKRIGPQRLNGTYAFRSLIDSGAHVAFGSDWPVAPLDPLTGVVAAVLRQTTDGANPEGWLPDQRVTVEQALHAYTSEAAYAGFMEDRSGKLAVGNYADLTILDTNLLKVEPALISKAKVLYTFVDGRQRFASR